MQTFAEFMAESFRSGVNLEWDLASRRRATAGFTVHSVKVVVSFEQRESDGPWHVLFEVEKGEATEVALTSFSIFNGVFQAVKEFIEIRQPEALVFTTKRDEVAGIYQTYLQRESAALTELGYRLEGPIRLDPFVEFALRRVKPSGWKS